MLNILGEFYYIDLDEVDSACNIPNTKSEVDEKESDDSIQINVMKWEIVKMLLEVVMSEREEMDEMIGKHNQTTLPFKLAFNTLLHKKIIKKL
jgi:hypothetical protein